MRRAIAVLFLALAACAPGGEAPDFNPGAIAWVGHEAGLERARELGKPICLVLYAPWCPHCHALAEVFHDPEIVGLSGRFVMILVNRDERADLGHLYDLDGDYVPRTLFFSSEGVVDPAIHADRQENVYAYAPVASELAFAMKAALARL